MDAQKAQALIVEMAEELLREQADHAKSANSGKAFTPSAALAEKLARHAAGWENTSQILNLDMAERDPRSRDN
jgi:hypothetical protein